MKTIQSVLLGATLLTAITVIAQSPAPEPAPLGKMIQKLQLWAQLLLPKVALSEDTDYTPEEFQLLYGIQQFGHSLGDKPLITMIGMQEAEDRPAPMSVEQWHALHKEKVEEKRAFQTLSTNSKVIEVQDAGHAIHLQDPDAVVNAIHEVMNALLHNSRLEK